MKNIDLYYQDLLRVLGRRPSGYRKWEGRQSKFVFMLYADEIEAILNATPHQRALAERTAAFEDGGSR